MAYLLAKYTLIFLLAAILGFLLGRMWTRRNFVEVTESYEALTKSAAAREAEWQTLWTRLDAQDEGFSANVRKEIAAIPAVEIPDVDLSGVVSRLDDVAKKVDGIRIPEPRETDLSGVLSDISGVSNKISAIRIPDAPQMPDLEPMTDRIAALESALRNLPQPETPDFEPLSQRLAAVESALNNIPQPRTPDLEPLSDRLAAVESAIKTMPQPERAPDLSPINARIGKVEDMIARLPKPKDPSPVDLSSVNNRIRELEAAVSRIPRPEQPRPVNFDPLIGRINSLEQAVGAIPKPVRPKDVDLDPVDRRLSAIELELKRLRSIKPAAPAPKKRAAKKKPRPDQPTLFKSASRGKKDDLKKISGVGPKLERLLNRNGVYYFWQVSQWNKKDIAFIDDRLQAFKGRISRDNWVRQARSLKKAPGAAKE